MPSPTFLIGFKKITQKKGKPSEKTTSFVIWICSELTHREIEQIIQGFMEVLANLNPGVKPKMITPYCHKFNLIYKEEVDHLQASDEAYIKVRGKNNYVFFFISSKSRKITA